MQCIYLDFDSQVQWRIALCIKDGQLDTKVDQFLGDVHAASLNSLQACSLVTAQHTIPDSHTMPSCYSAWSALNLSAIYNIIMTLHKLVQQQCVALCNRHAAYAAKL